MSGSVGSVIQSVLGRDARPDEVQQFEADLNAGWSLSSVRWVVAHGSEASAAITADYEQILGRDPSAIDLEWQEHQGLYDGLSLSDVRYNIAFSTEAQGDVGWLFHNIIGRDANAADYAYWGSYLSQGGTSLAQIRNAFVTTPEATAGINGAFQQGLGRQATGAELSYYQGYLNAGGSLDGVRYGVFHSTDEGQAINSLYLQDLGRPATANDITWQEDAGLSSGLSLSDIHHNIAYSDEAARGIAAVFHDLAGREAQSFDFAFWQNMFSQTTSLADLRWAYGHSSEAIAQVNAISQSMFGHGVNDPNLLVSYENNLGWGWSMSQVRWDLAHGSEASAAITLDYRQILGVDPLAQDVAWQEEAGLLGGLSLAQIRNNIAYSADAVKEINKFYLQETGRLANSDEISLYEYCFNVNTGGDSNWDTGKVRWTIGHSDAAMTAVNNVFQNVLGGIPSDSGALLPAYENNLGWGWTLDAVRSDLAYRPEATAAVTGLYLQLLGRNPNAGDLKWAEDSLAQGVSYDNLRLAIAHSAEARADFDAAYYLATYKDVAASGADPYLNYILTGWKEGRNPSALFDTTYYLDMNPDVAAAGINPLLHYRNFGWHEGRDPSMLFSTSKYIAAYWDIKAANIDPLAHYVSNGRSEGRTAFLAPLDSVRTASIQAMYVEVLGRLATDTEVFNRQVDLTHGQSMATLRMTLAGGTDAANAIQSVFQAVTGHGANGDEVTAWQHALGGDSGWTLDLVGPSIAKSEIDRFYQQMFGRNAAPDDYADKLAALEGGQSLKSQFDFLRPIFAHSQYETDLIDIFYKQTFNIDAPQVASSGALGNIENALAAGQSLLAIEDSLTPVLTKQIEGLYGNYLGRTASWDELWYWISQANAGSPLDTIRAQIADSPEAAAHIGTLIQQNFGRPALAAEITAWQAGEAAPGNAGLSYTVTTGDGRVLATADARTIVVESAVYIGLAGGTAPTLTGPGGQVVQFQNGYAFLAYAMGLAMRSGQMTAALMQTYNLTVSWMDQVGQAEIEAAVKLQDMANAERAAGNVQDAYLHYIGAQLATKMQEMGDQRLPVSASVTLGQYVATVSINGDRNDTRGLAGFSVTYTDADPDRTRLIALAQQAVGRAAADAGNTLLSFLDNAQARVDVAYANLPAGARTDRMLAVAQRFVDAAYQAAGIGNWNLVQTLETAADLSIQIAAQPEGSRHALTERFMHKNVKHDITVDPNTADPFASFTDHSKGEDIIGAVVEGVVGVVINILAVIPATAPVFAPLAVAWDTAQAGKNFAEGNILGGFLSLGAAAGVGLNGFAIAAQGAAPGSFYAEAANFTNSFATNTLGFTATTAIVNGAPTTISATAHLGQTILAGTALIGGASGIAQSAANGDPLGIAAGVLEIAAAVAGGLISTNTLSTPLTQAISLYAGVGSTATSVADAFKNGDLAGGLAGSLNALLPLIAQQVLRDGGGSNQTAVAATTPQSGADVPSFEPYQTADNDPANAFAPAGKAGSGNTNNLQHDRGVARAIDYYRSLGAEIITTTQVQVQVPGFETTRNYDFVIRDPESGRYLGIEVKTTLGDVFRLNREQVQKDVVVLSSKDGGFSRALGVQVTGVGYYAVCFGCQTFDVRGSALEQELRALGAGVTKTLEPK